ncbi:MAG: hypothetical protein CVU44_12845 [Chloroflexi bacterium HGW-Chloroflexi-6]|nr:MAG: hypothetical protein CVU44_12845 [Chloroflexi bacterium HGW-Chloroflexi-6]
MNKRLQQFNLRLDQLLGIQPGALTQPGNSQERAALETAHLLHNLNFDAEMTPKDIFILKPFSQRRTFMQTLRAKPALMILFVLLALALLSGAAYAIGRSLGYIYLPDSGFLPADSTLVLAQPVRQEYEGRSLTITRGLSTPDETRLWLEFSDRARPVDGAHLILENDQTLTASSWQYTPNTPETRGVLLVFPALSGDTTHTTLALPEGWNLPLVWLPASESSLPNVSLAPYPTTSAESTTCQESNGLKACLLAAATTETETSILIEVQSLHPELQPGAWVGQVWQFPDQPVELRDTQGNIYPLIDSPSQALSFPPLSPNQTLTLSIPALLATADLIGQSLTVDVGDNPQPETVIPLDITIPAMGIDIHFSQATFEGDGVNSLRLILNADPIQPIGGILPVALEIGKPDRVDDLYGGGMFAGSKDIFIELLRPSGKINGVIHIPLEKVILAVQGPFEFTFTLPDSANLPGDPVQADPGNFVPQLTVTPLPLDGYSFFGASPQPGELLFSAIETDTTTLFALSPLSEPRRLATLPGAVAQVYVHPDNQGIDYLAGLPVMRDGFFYIKDLGLYSLRFDGSLPKFLHTFPPAPANTVGTIVEGHWSFDGRYAIFRYVNNQPGNNFWQFLWLDLACRTDGNCIAHEITSRPDIELYKALFAPSDYRILFTGADYSGTGEQDIFLLDFDPADPGREPVNLTSHSSDFADDVGVSPAVWTPDGSIFTLCSDGQMTNRFCTVNSVSGNIINGAVYDEHLFQYALTPTGRQMIGIVINHTALGKGTLELRLFDMDGQPGLALVSAPVISNVVMSEDERFIACITGEPGQLTLLDLANGQIQTLPSSAVWGISWTGWVR